MTNRASFYATRALIGLFEGGFIPGVILMATYFYTSKELSVRLAAFWSTLNIASKFLSRLPSHRKALRQDRRPSLTLTKAVVRGNFCASGCWPSRNERHPRTLWLVLAVPPGGPPNRSHWRSILPLPSDLANWHQDRHMAQPMVHGARGSNHDKPNPPRRPCQGSHWN